MAKWGENMDQGEGNGCRFAWTGARSIVSVLCDLKNACMDGSIITFS